ncbi:hypothetical protein NFX46_26745 [Streptomyces phaeoluteigriseus]|uniref:Uncharacterized protein n=1 Tax=Streptomyces phaeoluteigriseus TaxID=114686 RepID=A0ABY4ZD85_9ACTN|nr:hypothetical protein [Streptomyces phaeoluteigriseus]USQ86998.1 hypothetical protein NFX46_26745 [Streptomyces phaeoluteigriseus]
MSRIPAAVQAPTLVVGALPPARRLIAADYIRRTTGRILTVNAVGPLVTATLRKTEASR